MMVVFSVEWACGCGCGDTHALYLGTHRDALDLVGELQRKGTAVEIVLSRWRLPRRKEAILLALNQASGADVEIEGETETLAHFVREDRERAEEPAVDKFH